MVEKNIQTEIFLELVFSASGEIDEQIILNKSIPLYLRKLNCFQAGVLKNSENRLKEFMLIPLAASKSKEWPIIKEYFADLKPIDNGPYSQMQLEGSYFYAYCLSTYGILILGRKKPFDITFTNELVAIVNHLGKFLIQAKEIEKREKAEKSLRESEQRLRTLSETTTAGIFIFYDEKIVYANPAAEKYSGYSSKELMTLNIMDLVHPDFKKQIFELRIANQSKRDKTTYFEIKILRKDGAECWVDINIGYINWMGEKAVIFSAFDTTKHKQTELDLIKAKEKAEESDRLKTAFLQNMSHEIRTPMNAIMGFSELFVKYYNDKPKLERFSEIINQRCIDLLDIINDILDIAKIESGQLAVNLENCNIRVLFDELTLFFKEHQARLNKHQITFNLQVLSDTSELVILTDKVKLRQIFINLISNAFKFTDSGKIEGGCKFDANNNLIFFVSDTGIGIPPDKQEHIFERFAQVDYGNNRLYGGTGLGLSIVKGIVGLLDGKIWLESEPGKGSTFYFSVPYIIAPLLPTETKSIDNPKDYRFPDKTMLIVEDDPYNALYLKEILSDTGLNILYTQFGKEAVEISLNQHVNIVLMDIRLPDMDGYKATQQIKQLKPHIIVISQTAYASSEDKQKAIDAGCSDYISKPIKPDLLLSMINKHLLSH